MYCSPPQKFSDNFLQPKENCVSTGYHRKKDFAFQKSRARQGRGETVYLLFVFFSLVHLCYICLSLIQKTCKSKFRVFQEEILGHSNSNLRHVEAVESNPKSEGVLPWMEIDSGTEPCPEFDGKHSWISIILYALFIHKAV